MRSTNALPNAKKVSSKSGGVIAVGLLATGLAFWIASFPAAVRAFLIHRSRSPLPGDVEFETLVVRLCFATSMFCIIAATYSLWAQRKKVLSVCCVAAAVVCIAASFLMWAVEMGFRDFGRGR